MNARFLRFPWSLAIKRDRGQLGRTAARSGEPARQPRRRRSCFRRHLTAGLGLAEPAEEAFPALIKKKLDADHRAWRVVNAGLSGETTSAGLRRIEWVMRQPFDLIVLELGGK